MVVQDHKSPLKLESYLPLSFDFLLKYWLLCEVNNWKCDLEFRRGTFFPETVYSND